MCPFDRPKRRKTAKTSRSRRGAGDEGGPGWPRGERPPALWDPQKQQLWKLMRGASLLEILAEMARVFRDAAEDAAREGDDCADEEEFLKAAVVLERMSGDMPELASVAVRKAGTPLR